MKKKIIFSTGGTGGHIFPAIHLMSHFFEKNYDTILVTDVRGDSFIKKNLKFKSYILPADTPTNKKFLKRILSFLLIFYSIIKSIIILKKEKPDLVFGMGGYVSFPISLTSKLFNIPLVIYESNMVLGRANKILAPISKKIFLSKKNLENYSDKYKVKTRYVSSIVAKKIINYKSTKRNENNNFSILVLGGSQGAEVFGDVIPPVINLLKSEGFNIKIAHQCIAMHKKKISDYYKKYHINNYVFEFNKDVEDLIASSNLAITRCGASTTAELVYMLTPFIAVPIPNSVDNHQFLNAKYYENEGCCWILEQKYFNKQNLHDLIVETIKNKNKLENIKQNMKKNNYTNAYKEIEKEIEKII